MGRAGGSSGGSHSSHSSGSHSSSRSSGSHRVGGGSRAGASSSYHSSRGGSSFHSSGSSYRPSSSSSYHNHTTYHTTVYNNTPPSNYYGRSYNSGYVAPPPPARPAESYNYGRRQKSSAAKTVITLLVVFMVVWVLINVVMVASGPKSTIQRTKLTNVPGYKYPNVIDEIHWINNPSKTSSGLKNFYDKTGISPYIYFRAYDPKLITDAQKEQWARDYYDENFTEENIFLFVYFAEKNTDEDVGLMTYVNGKQTNEIMDPEAVDIFWRYMDSAWTSWDADDTDGMLIHVFNKTASTIMKVSTTTKDIIGRTLIVIIICSVGIVIVTIINKTIEMKKQEAENTERILNAPLEHVNGGTDRRVQDLEDEILH